ncbi:MAG: SPASM domain-containing protein [Magnetococcales bacterium]|nr:SPASM domain-containing protein [Magnetococcales bacterium]MBF0114199.1 SPASM domain-containing protein [Magnetococcales bacterium]
MSQHFRWIAIETTTHCNSQCTVCPHDTLFRHPFTTMSGELFEKCLLEIAELHTVSEHIRFGGMGDPSCDNQLLERLRFMQKETPNLQPHVASNMASWKKRDTEAVIQEQLLPAMRFSLLGLTPEGSMRAYQRSEQGERASRAIDYFLQYNAQSPHPVRTELYTLLMPDDQGEVAQIKARFWDRVDAFEVWRPHSWSNLLPHLRANQVVRRRCSKLIHPEPVICVNGDVCPCSMDVNRELAFGNLAEHSLQEIYQGSAWHRLVELNAQGLIETLPTCHGCTFLNADGSGVLIEHK